MAYRFQSVYDFSDDPKKVEDVYYRIYISIYRNQ